MLHILFWEGFTVLLMSRLSKIFLLPMVLSPNIACFHWMEKTPLKSHRRVCLKSGCRSLSERSLFWCLGVDEVTLIDQDGSPHGPQRFVLWNPPLTHFNAGLRAANPDGTTSIGQMSRTEGRARKQERKWDLDLQIFRLVKCGFKYK